MEAVNICSIIKDALLALSAVVVAFIAWQGLQTWRKELTGKARFDCARKLMHLGFELRSNFSAARNPFGYARIDRKGDENEREKESEVVNEWEARRIRANPLGESLNKIIEAQWEAEILLSGASSESVREAVQSYRECYGELSSAIAEYFDTRLDEVRRNKIYKDQKWLTELSKTIYGGPPDNFSKKIDEATDKLSSTLKQYVK